MTEYDIGVDRAWDIIRNNVSLLPPEKISIMKAAGRVITMEAVAGHDLPSELQSAVDGYALGNESAPVSSRFTLQGHPGPNEYPQFGLAPGEAMEVLTGGALPPGTGAVVPHEKAVVDGDVITVLEEVKPGNNIKRAGEDFRQGQMLLRPYTRLDAGSIGLMAAFGHSEVLVQRRPQVVVLGLSKNVVPCNQSPAPGQIRDANGPMLAALVNQSGGKVVASYLASQLGNRDWSAWLAELAMQVDLLIITGGTYAREQSETRELLSAAGATIIYWGTAIQPGSHNGLACYRSVPVFALSGNPAACAVGFHLFVAPALRLMQGLEPGLKRVQARCINTFPKQARSHRFVRGRAWYTDAGWEVEVLPGQKPSMLRSLINCNALVDMPPGHPPLATGSSATVILL